MNITSIENPNSSQVFDGGHAIEILEIRNRTSNWLLDIVAYVIVATGCTVLAGAGFYYGVSQEQHAQVLERALTLLIGVIGLFGTYRILESALKRFNFYKDQTPKLTLSKDAFCDHRSGTNVELIDVEAIQFDNRYIKSNEIRADFHLKMTDGTEHIFDLRELDLPSEEIAWRITANTSVKNADGVIDPANKKLCSATKVLIGVIAVVALARIIYLLVVIANQ